MTLIGLAYNQKPEPTELASPESEGGRQEDGELSRPDEEPPSRIAGLSVAQLIARDEFAEWDSPTTIAAVESALSRLRKSHPPRGKGRFSGEAPAGPARHRLQHRRRISRSES